MRKKLLMKSLLVAAGLFVGASAWADETANLTPTADTYFDWMSGNTENCYGTSTTLYGGWWTELWSDGTPGLKGYTKSSTNNISRIAVLKFDISDYKGKITNAVFKATATNTGNNKSQVRLGYCTTNAWPEESTASNSGVVTRSATDLNIGTFDISSEIATNTSNSELSFTNSDFISYLNNDEDGIVSLTIYCTTRESYINSREATTGKPSLVLTYSNETLYTATFSETNSLEPTISIFSDEERTAAVTNGTLTNGTTYYYTASLAGYTDYTGSFTVSGANPTVNFTMTAKTRYTFTVNAVDASSNVIKAIYTDADSYEGKTHTIVYPKYLTGTGNIVTYSKDNNTYGESKTAQAQDETYTVSYTAYDGVAYFVEVEDVVSATAYGSWNCSNGAAVRGFTTAKDIFTVPATGVYDITYAACNNNVNSTLSVTLSKNDTEIATKSDLQYVSINYIKSTGIVSESNVSLASEDVLRLTPSSTNGIIDYMLVERKSVSATIGATGYTTFASTEALDLSALPAGLTAYYASAVGTEDVTFTSLDVAVPAGTGLLLKGTAGESYSIPVAASADALAGNKLVGCTESTDLTANANYWVLVNNAGAAEFQSLKTKGATIPAGKAYLNAAAAGARLAIVFNDETTGIATVENASVLNENCYNLNGQRIVAPQKGLFIVNGKKVVLK